MLVKKFQQPDEDCVLSLRQSRLDLIRRIRNTSNNSFRRLKSLQPCGHSCGQNNPMRQQLFLLRQYLNTLKEHPR